MQAKGDKEFTCMTYPGKSPSLPVRGVSTARGSLRGRSMAMGWLLFLSGERLVVVLSSKWWSDRDEVVGVGRPVDETHELVSAQVMMYCTVRGS